MKLNYRPTAALFLLLSPVATFAQILTTGSLPTCAQSCTYLQQAVQACSGTTSEINQQTWSCFCQSAYLSSLYPTDGSGDSLCASVCTDAADAQAVGSWYRSECGGDHGASEHAAAFTSTTSAAAATGTASTTKGGAASSATATGSSSSGATAGAGSTSSKKSWWSAHHKWVVMLIGLLCGLLLFAAVLVFLKRRHDRKADDPSQTFNAGITTRAPPMTESVYNNDGAGTRHGLRDSSYLSSSSQHQQASTLEAGSGSGRNSPARTRDAFMPYGYNYTRSESRLGSRENDIGGQQGRVPSPLGRPVESEGGDGIEEKGKRRILVRERDMHEGDIGMGR